METGSERRKEDTFTKAESRTKVEKGNRERIRKEEEEGGENLPIYPLLDSLSLFFLRPVEIVNGFLLGDLPRSVNASAD